MSGMRGSGDCTPSLSTGLWCIYLMICFGVIGFIHAVKPRGIRLDRL